MSERGMSERGGERKRATVFNLINSSLHFRVSVNNFRLRLLESFGESLKFFFAHLAHPKDESTQTWRWRVRREERGEGAKKTKEDNMGGGRESEKAKVKERRSRREKRGERERELCSRTPG